MLRVDEICINIGAVGNYQSNREMWEVNHGKQWQRAMWVRVSDPDMPSKARRLAEAGRNRKVPRTVNIHGRYRGRAAFQRRANRMESTSALAPDGALVQLTELRALLRVGRGRAASGIWVHPNYLCLV